MILLTSAQMKHIDNFTINELGISQLTLMNNAAESVFSVLKRDIDSLFDKDSIRIIVVAGPGNNGCDGIICAKKLFLAGFDTTLLNICSSKGISELNEKLLLQYENLGGKVSNQTSFEGFTHCVDALFGTGLNRDIEGEAKDIINNINKSSQNNGMLVYSVDVPSGLNSDTGEICGACVKAYKTVCFAYLKKGLFLNYGFFYSGIRMVKDIGINIDNTDLSGQKFPFTFLDRAPLPKRNPVGNKKTFGRILIIAGNHDIFGACFLSSMASFRSGAGYVEIFTHKNNEHSLKTLIPEALFHFYENESDFDRLKPLLDRCDAFCIGPGIGTDDLSGKLLEFVLNNRSCPGIFDADAINILAGDYFKNLYKTNVSYKDIFTPHPLELSRLTGLDADEILENYEKNALDTAKEYDAVFVCKGPGTIVSDGENVYINSTGNDGMATAGSGDVLSGICASFIASFENSFDAAVSAVFYHGLSGDLAKDRTNAYSVMARDICDNLMFVYKDKNGKEM